MQEKKHVALVIGHCQSSQGATNLTSGITEFQFNHQLALSISEYVAPELNVTLVYRSSYKNLPHEINMMSPDFIVSLHANAFNRSVSGTEVLYYHRSEPSWQLAQNLQSRLVKALELPDRGVKPRSTEDRGGYLLRYTDAPCVIAEPFFIDNDLDFNVVKQRRKALVLAYADAIKHFARL